MPSPAPLDTTIWGLTKCGRETLRHLFLHGPTWDLNLPSKQGSDELVIAGYARRWAHWCWLTDAGVEYAITRLCLDEEKARLQRPRGPRP